MKKLKVILVLTVITFLIAACQQDPSPEEKMYDHLEKTVELEDEFVAQQEPMTSLEEQEKKIYDQIIELGTSEMDQIQSLADDAIELINERRELLDSEKESIQAAQEEFAKVEALIDEIEGEETKEKAEQLNSTMKNRYEVYDKLYGAYSNALKLDEELYTMLKDEELSKEDLEAQIESINTSYDEIFTLTEEFNNATDQYNEIKKEFYDLAGIQIEYES
ncbi:YkyA family protein [Salirhabdus sp. Marseille-P4669]|uniref:YkyA family protein n=1 Tax=Salirhabdus sp. Marseille-P4669 TaxID=2042310 RepID=UPI001359A7D9|nr:YkyA family protein [Salirhabdus sp. Marseille-P4669]